MSRKIMITGVTISITFVLTLFVAYGQPLRNSLFARRVKELFPSSVNHANATHAELQKAKADRAKVRSNKTLTSQPEALKLSRRIGGERFESSTTSSLILQGVLKADGDSQNITVVRRQEEDGERVEVALSGNQASLVWAKDSGPQGFGRSLIKLNASCWNDLHTTVSINSFWPNCAVPAIPS